MRHTNNSNSWAQSRSGRPDLIALANAAMKESGLDGSITTKMDAIALLVRCDSYPFPALRGSRRQVRYGQDCRARIVSASVIDGLAKYAGQPAIESALVALLDETSSAFWSTCRSLKAALGESEDPSPS